VDRNDRAWIKASKSDPEGNCVEMRRCGGLVAVRDSKHPDVGVLSVSPEAFERWLRGARSGQFDVMLPEEPQC